MQRQAASGFRLLWAVNGPIAMDGQNHVLAQTAQNEDAGLQPDFSGQTSSIPTWN